MDSLVERLRHEGTLQDLDAWGVSSGLLEKRQLSLGLIGLLKEAANEIERTNAQVSGLEAALRLIVKIVRDVLTGADGRHS